MKKISCSVCNKLFEKEEYFWFDDTTEKYFCNDCRENLNNNHNLLFVKINEDGFLKVIRVAEYAAGPISTKEWIVYDFDEFYTNHSFCPHAKEDFYNSIPVFCQNKKFYCSKCYENLKDKHGECIVYLGNNKIRSLHYGLFPYSNIKFNFLVTKIQEDKFKINVNINNLKSSNLYELNIYLFSFSNGLKVYEDEIEYFSEVPEYLANLIIFKEEILSILNSNDEYKSDFVFEIPKNNSVKTFELALKNKLLTDEDLKVNNFYGIKEIKKLNSNLPLDVFIIVSFKVNYGIYQNHIEKISIE